MQGFSKLSSASCLVGHGVEERRNVATSEGSTGRGAARGRGARGRSVGRVFEASKPNADCLHVLFEMYRFRFHFCILRLSGR
jgi:hypothetical protein